MRLAVLLALGLAMARQASSQTPETPGDSLARYLQFEDPSPLSCLFTWFPPFFIQHGIELKAFIRSGTFRRIRQKYGDPRALDAIFIRAMQLTNNNTAVALLLSAISSFDHRLVGVRVPVFRLFFPLSDESDEEFARRVRHLPAKLYADSPRDSSGDRDKPQHFFGSAFFTFICESEASADRFGEFIERGEDAFIVGGVDDERDRRANHQGQRFGAALLDDNRRLPSDYLGLSHSSGSVYRNLPFCIGVW